MKLSGDNQDQHVQGGTAIQAGGDVHVGLRPGEVKEICLLYLENNFPKLRDEAISEAREHVDQFSEELMARLSEELDERLDERLKNPDVQASINDAVMHTARKTKNTNISMLSEMILEKIRSEEDDDDNLIITESIKAAEKLSISHIKAMSIVYLIRFTSLKRPRNKGVDYTVAYQHDYVKNVGGTSGVKRIDPNYLSYAGVTSEGKHYTKSLTDVISSKTGIKFGEEAKKEELGDDNEFSQKLPALSKMILNLGFSNIEEFDKMVLTFLGKAVSICYLNSKGYNFKITSGKNQ